MKVTMNRSTFGYSQIFSIFSIILLLLSFNYQISVFAASGKSNDDNKDDKKDLLNLHIKMNLNNIELKDTDKIKIVAYVNGEAKIQYLDPQKEKSLISENVLTSNIEFNKTNEISSIGNDEYFVCGYVLNDGQTKLANNYSAIKTYDCDEGQTIEGTDTSTARLFNTMMKFQKSLELNKLPAKGNHLFGDVKITVITPIYDQKDVDLLTVIAMVKGEYQMKTVNIEDEVKKTDDKSDESYIIRVPFTFDRNTELGTVEKGDMVFGCASAEELGPPQMTECEKKFIKDFDKPNKIVTRHEEDFRPGGEYYEDGKE